MGALAPQHPVAAAPLPLFDLRVEEEDLAAVAAALDDGRLEAGPRVAAFEEAFATHLGARHAVAVASCTAALHLTYLAAGVGPGDEVVVPSLTFAATAAAVRYCGATPVWADVLGPHDLGIDPADVERLIGPRTRAVVAMHFAGYPAAVEELRALCAERGVALLEDAAHAPTGSWAGGRLGTAGLAGCFSFFSNKVLAGGEGGLVATDDDALAEQVRRWREPPPLDGSDAEKRFDCRLDEPRAALLLARLGRLEADVVARRGLVRAYRERLAAVPGVVVPYDDTAVGRSACYVMPVLLTEDGRQSAVRRLMREEHGVQTSLLYPPTHLFSGYAHLAPAGGLERTESVGRREVTLPLFGHMTLADVDRAVAALADALERA